MIFTPRPVFIYISLVLAFILTIIPLPDFAGPFRPLWVAMTVLFWNITLPAEFNIGTSWIVGISLDIITGATLGQHALAMILMSYTVIRFYKQYRLFSVLQQLLLVFAALMAYLLINNWIWGIGGENRTGWADWSPLISSLLLWPWYQTLLSELNRYYRGMDSSRSAD